MNRKRALRLCRNLGAVDCDMRPRECTAAEAWTDLLECGEDIPGGAFGDYSRMLGGFGVLSLKEAREAFIAGFDCARIEEDEFNYEDYRD